MATEKEILQSDIPVMREALAAFTRHYEEVYYEYLPERLPAMKPVIHMISHFVDGIEEFGPAFLSSIWITETSGGAMVSGAKLKSNIYRHLSLNAIRTEQLNHLPFTIPRIGVVDINEDLEMQSISDHDSVPDEVPFWDQRRQGQAGLPGDAPSAEQMSVYSKYLEHCKRRDFIRQRDPMFGHQGQWEDIHNPEGGLNSSDSDSDAEPEVVWTPQNDRRAPKMRYVNIDGQFKVEFKGVGKKFTLTVHEQTLLREFFQRW
jgi:hypothetical protein